MTGGLTTRPAEEPRVTPAEPADLRPLRQVVRGLSPRSGRASRDPQPGITAAFRISILALALALLLASRPSPWDALWLLPLVVTELWVRGRGLADGQLAALAYWWVAISALGVFFTGGSHSPMLPGILVGTFLAGLAFGIDGVLVASGIASVLLLTMWGVGYGQLPEPAQQYLGTCAEWVLLGVCVGLAGQWMGRRQAGPDGEAAERYAEARALLNQLRSVTSRLPGSLDVATTCEVLLEECLGVCQANAGVVLVHAGGGNLVPITLRGARRVPWRSPAAGPGPLQRAWETGEPVLDVRKPDASDTPADEGRRQGSALLVVPIHSPEGMLGLVAVQTSAYQELPADVIDRVQATVERYAVPLETAQLFETVRAASTVEERSRLAHDMHDGVAQDLAYIGFELDLLRTQAARLDPALGESVAELRHRTTRIIADIRGSITDLRSSRSVERGLGAALTSFIRNAGATGHLSIHLTLDESAFRMPAAVEVELLRLAQEFTSLASNESDARNLWVTLVVEPPVAYLRLDHDGAAANVTTSLTGAGHRLEALGGTLTVVRVQPTGMSAEAMVGGSTDDDQRPAG
ncbi:MAG: hypothetical protein QOJ83_3168 [Frankiales bacterium]|nr:hypothetical protein [Frankiales bacterium]